MEKRIDIDQNNIYSTTDLKLQAFLRLKSTSSFIGINNTNPRRVIFVFRKSDELMELVNGYFQGKEYMMSPLLMANYIDQGKTLIFSEYTPQEE